MFNQTLLTTVGSTSNHNTGSINDLHKKINMDRQPAPTFDSNDPSWTIITFTNGLR